MGARGHNLAVDTHIVNILPPQNVSGGVSSTPFHLKLASHASIAVQIGALSASLGAVTLLAGTSSAMTTSQAIPFSYYTQTTPGAVNDVTSLRQTATAAGFVPANAPNTFFDIEVQADQLPQGYPYLQLVISNGTDTDFVSAIAILSGIYAGDQNPTATN